MGNINYCVFYKSYVCVLNKRGNFKEQGTKN